MTIEEYDEKCRILFEYAKTECQFMHGEGMCSFHDPKGIGCIPCVFSAPIRVRESEIKRKPFVITCAECMSVKYHDRFDVWWDVKHNLIANGTYYPYHIRHMLESFFSDKEDIWKPDIIILNSMKD